MRTPVTRTEKLAGLVVVLGVSILVATLFLAARRQNFFRIAKSFQVYTFLDKGYGLKNGAAVLIKDVEAGVVTDVTLVHANDEIDVQHRDRMVRVTIRVDGDFPEFLTARTRARVKRPIIGSSLIELWDAGGDTSALRNGATIEPDDALPESLEEKVEKIKEDVKSARGEMTVTLKDVQKIVANIRDTTDDLRAGKGVLGKLLLDEGLAATASHTLADVRATAENARRASESVAPITSDVRALVGDLRGTVKDVRQDLDRLPEIIASVRRSLAEAEELMANLRAASGGVPEVVRKADRATDETTRVMEAAQRSFLLRGNVRERPKVASEAEALPRAGSGSR